MVMQVQKGSKEEKALILANKLVQEAKEQLIEDFKENAIHGIIAGTGIELMMTGAKSLDAGYHAAKALVEGTYAALLARGVK